MSRLVIHTQEPAEVAAKWRKQYEKEDGSWASCLNGSGLDIYVKLMALPRSATVADIQAVIGNRGWSDNLCRVCAKNASLTVDVGSQVYQGEWRVCRSCLLEAVALIDGYPSPLSTVEEEQDNV